MTPCSTPDIAIDGGDLGCGELLLLVHARIRTEMAGVVVAITTTDPAAPLDIPAWCFLTGHEYGGPASTPAENVNARTYLVVLAAATRQVDPLHPWHPVHLLDDPEVAL